MSFSTIISARALNSSSVYAVPVGFEGLLSMKTLVLVLIASLSCSGVTLNFVESSVSRMTGVAPAR